MLFGFANNLIMYANGRHYRTQSEHLMVKGQGLHQDFLEIDVLVVSDRGQ